MKEPVFVRSLTAGERASLRVGLRNGNAFTLRRPHWMHRKRVVVEPQRKRMAKELVGRVCGLLWV
jgi:hypothetical protein